MNGYADLLLSYGAPNPALDSKARNESSILATDLMSRLPRPIRKILLSEPDNFCSCMHARACLAD